ncbi:endonuclease domain-containing protein [Luteimonas suaedae]|uniref:endonuclease domain-containing protein n=1 Tax=Luteimonas suaedae TaxID=2605430 RepID=UPI0011EBE7CF|nr:endonuclease domain-containing protein [Luteimonas suaedae]
MPCNRSGKTQALRNAATDAERKLWHRLRGKQLGVKFRRQYPITGYVADFALPEARLVVELDGTQHQQQVSYDAERSRKFQVNGYRVLRFWNDDVLLRMEDVLERILRAITQPLRNPPGLAQRARRSVGPRGSAAQAGHPHPLQAGEGVDGPS